jgi:hypothetical protein
LSGSLSRIRLYAGSLTCARTDGASVSSGGGYYTSNGCPLARPSGGSPPMSAGALPPEFIFGSRRSSLIGCFSALCLHVSQLRPGLYCIVLSSRLCCLRVVCINMNEFFPTPVGTPGGKPLRLTARVKIARARPDRFWPARPFFRVCVCVSVCLSVCQSVVPNLDSTAYRFERKEAVRFPPYPFCSSASRSLARPVLDKVDPWSSHSS